MASYSQTVLDEIRAATDIVDFVSRFVNLKKAGQNWKGLCPFHMEKTPSFMVNPRKGIFHCFGCGVGGDAFGFRWNAQLFAAPGYVAALVNFQGSTSWGQDFAQRIQGRWGDQPYLDVPRAALGLLLVLQAHVVLPRPREERHLPRRDPRQHEPTVGRRHHVRPVVHRALVRRADGRVGDRLAVGGEHATRQHERPVQRDRDRDLGAGQCAAYPRPGQQRLVDLKGDPNGSTRSTQR